MENIGQKIKELRLHKKKTQKQVADFLECTEAQISYIEKGQRKISIKDVYRLTEFFDVKSDYFFTKSSNFINFRSSTMNDVQPIDEHLVSDFKKFAIKKLYGNKKKGR